MGFFSKNKKQESRVEPVDPWTAFFFGLISVASLSGFTDAELDALDRFKIKNEKAFEHASDIDAYLHEKGSTIGERAEIVAMSLTEEQVSVAVANLIELALVEINVDDFMDFMSSSENNFENFENYKGREDGLAEKMGLIGAIYNHKFGVGDPAVEEDLGNIAVTIAMKNNIKIFNN